MGRDDNPVGDRGNRGRDWPCRWPDDQVAALRNGANPAEASRHRRRAVGIALLVGAAALVVIALTGEHHKYLSLAVAAFMAIAAIWELRGIKRTDPKT